jgi:digeranylgeranylglycerophospholipid reductase
MFDVIVIGGNFAGASAAINAAEKDVSVVLVERNKEPYNPAHCGEGIVDETGELFGLNNMNCLQNKIKKIIINITSPKEYILKLKKHSVIIFDRNYVENELLKKAKKNGAELILGKSMKKINPPNEIVLDDNKKITGKVIIDASGIACQVGRRVGLESQLKAGDIGVCIQSRVEGNFDKETVKTWFHKPYAPFGYSWLFPINDKMANIGVGLKGGQDLNLDKLLKHYINDETKGKYKIHSTFRACVPITKPLFPLIKDNVMVVGDAARLADPVIGAGIKQALISGCLAGKVAANYVKGELSSLEKYQDLMLKIVTRLNKFF